MREELTLFAATMLEAHISVILFSIFVFPILLYVFFDFFSFLGVVIPAPKPSCVVRAKQEPEQEPEQEQDPDWFGTWNDKPDDPWFDPEPTPETEPQTDPQLIEDVISGLQNLGFKKREARITVLKVCEGRVFEDHQSLIEAALNKSNL